MKTFERFGLIFHITCPGLRWEGNGSGTLWTFLALDETVFQLFSRSLISEPRYNCGGKHEGPCTVKVFCTDGNAAEALAMLLYQQKFTDCSVGGTKGQKLPSNVEEADDDCPSCWGTGRIKGWGAPCQQEGCVA